MRNCESSMSAQGLTWREIGSMRGTIYSSDKFQHVTVARDF